MGLRSEGTDDWDGAFKASVAWKVEKVTDAPGRINFSFVWRRHQQQCSPRCIYGYERVHELLRGVGVFPPVGAVLLTTCEQRLRKMFVLALVVLLHHEVLGNTVKLSEPKGPRM